METVRENAAVVPDPAPPLREAGTPTAATPLLRQTGDTDTGSTSQGSAKSPQAFPWRAAGI
jgi:hypothetical protein